jgi:protein phosphatase
VNELLRGGQIAEAEVPKFVAKNVITRSVGFEAEVQPDILERELQPGDHFLLCSDGLSGLIPPDELLNLMRKLSNDPEALVKSLIESAKSHGGDDNITAVFLAARQKA